MAARGKRAAARKIYRIGYLSPTTGLEARDKAFLQGLQELGYIEGKNIVIDYRFAHGKFERLAELATELVRLDVDVIVAAVTQASIAAKAATSKIPVVILAVSDPVGSGLVTSLARPDANVTGTSSMTGEVVGKSLELLKDIVPEAFAGCGAMESSQCGFPDPDAASDRARRHVLGVQLREVRRGTDEIDHAFDAIRKAHVDALLVMADPTFIAIGR